MDFASNSNFENALSSLSSFTFKEVDDQAILKVKVSSLESNQQSLIKYNEASQESTRSLFNAMNNNDSHIRDSLALMQQAFDQRIEKMQKEYDHRFELQSTENKRLQNHIAILKSDVHQLKRKMNTVIDKVKYVQRDLGIEEEWGGDEDQGTVVSGFSLSRPNTGDYK